MMSFVTHHTDNGSDVAGCSAYKQDSQHTCCHLFISLIVVLKVFVLLWGKAWVKNVLSVILGDGGFIFFYNNHNTFLGRENKFRRETKCMKNGKLLLMKSVKEIIQIETLCLKIWVGRLKSKYNWKIRAVTQKKRKRKSLILRRSFELKSLEILPNQTAWSEFHEQV